MRRACVVAGIGAIPTSFVYFGAEALDAQEDFENLAGIAAASLGAFASACNSVVGVKKFLKFRLRTKTGASIMRASKVVPPRDFSDIILGGFFGGIAGAVTFVLLSSLDER